MQAMQVDEALGFADQWIDGVTVYEGLQGWRIVCATLAAEVRQLRSDLALAQGQRDELEVLRADATRYRWLRNGPGVIMEGRDFWKVGDGLDAAIDAAMQKGE